MKNVLFVLVGVMLGLATSISAQSKKVAVVSFSIDRYIGTSQLNANASLAADIASVAGDPNFDLKPILDNFHKTFFEEYSKGFPFELIAEDQIINNEQYKSYKTTDTTSSHYLMTPGYNFLTVMAIYKYDLSKMIQIFPEADGFMFVNVHFEFAPKTAVAGMGSAAVYAYADIRLWNKLEKKVVNIHEGSMSKKSVKMVAGIPICKTSQILPLCQEAADQLIIDLKGRLPKIVKKAAKKL